MDKRAVLDELARNIRIETLRCIGARGFGHVGGSMSIADLLAVLYGSAMRYDPKNPAWADRDWLVVSKGHAGPAVYAALALQGFFPKEELLTLNQPGTSFPSHCDRQKTPGIDMTTGSLGQGLSAACGIALGHKLQGKENYTYAIIGDGESQEGQVWEAALFAPQYCLDHLILFVDNNKDQIDGYTRDVMNMEDFSAKFQAFNWHVQRIDGHDVLAIDEAIEQAKAAAGKPSVIVLNTVKGKGCSFAEGQRGNHHMRLVPGQIEEGLRALGAE